MSVGSFLRLTALFGIVGAVALGAHFFIPPHPPPIKKNVYLCRLKRPSVTLLCVRVHVLAIRWGLVRPHCDGTSLLSC
jgi:hypothetical protein